MELKPIKHHYYKYQVFTFKILKLVLQIFNSTLQHLSLGISLQKNDIDLMSDCRDKP